MTVKIKVKPLHLCLSSMLLSLISSFSNHAVVSSSARRNIRKPFSKVIIQSATSDYHTNSDVDASDRRRSAADDKSISLRRRLLSGGKSYGPVIMSNSDILVELLAQLGYGHMVIDHEHSPTGIESGQRLLQAMDAAAAFRLQPTTTMTTASTSTRWQTEPIVRLPGHNPEYMKKVLDSMRLPGGVLVPMVEDAETAKQVVQSTRYPRQQQTMFIGDDNGSGNDDDGVGIRGCAAPFIRGSGWGQNPNYLEQCQEDLLVMVQVETPQGVEAIPDIASIDGVDAIFLGPFDLSCSVGKMGKFDDEEVQALIKGAEGAVRESSCLLAGFRLPNRSLQEMFDCGYSLVCGSVDLGLLREAARQDVEAANNAMK